jgi:hypothetical protein
MVSSAGANSLNDPDFELQDPEDNLLNTDIRPEAKPKKAKQGQQLKVGREY